PPPRSTLLPYTTLFRSSLIVGGVVDLQRLALSFTGAGSLTLPDVVSVDALGLFGVIETSGPLPDTFWFVTAGVDLANMGRPVNRSEEHTSELQSRENLV